MPRGKSIHGIKEPTHELAHLQEKSIYLSKLCRNVQKATLLLGSELMNTGLSCLSEEEREKVDTQLGEANCAVQDALKILEEYDSKTNEEFLNQHNRELGLQRHRKGHPGYFVPPDAPRPKSLEW